MNSEEVERITRIAQDLPVPKVTFYRGKVPEGEVYVAYGKGLNWHGVYAWDGPGGGVACPVEYRGQTTANKFRDILVQTARQELAIMETTCRK